MARLIATEKREQHDIDRFRIIRMDEVRWPSTTVVACAGRQRSQAPTPACIEAGVESPRTNSIGIASRPRASQLGGGMNAAGRGGLLGAFVAGQLFAFGAAEL